MDSSSVADYEVFLSFRGADTRQGFTDVLYDCMRSVEIRVFRDDDELEVGNKIDSIFEAIDKSKICIPIFSPRFAESKWCLSEVAKMVELKKTIIPIFCHVTSEDVKLKTSLYSDELQKLEDKYGEYQVQEWKDALEEVVSNKGRTLGGQGYIRFCKEFVDDVLSKLGPRKRLDLDYFAGEKNKDELIKLLDMSSSNKEVVCVGIYGMGGIGKTTITKLIYNEFLSRFDHCGFLPDIREYCGREGIKNLPKYLYDNLEPKPNMNFSRSDQIPGIFKDKKVLLILDDVDSYEQIKEIARVPSWFGSGSRIILTTRDKKVFEDYIVPHESKSEFRRLEMMELERVWALELFSKCAFEADTPPPCFQELSERVVAYAEGLPLTITVIGMYLRNQREVEIWEDFIERLRKSPPKKVKDKLMISYESLEDEQKTIFLDIACFFIDSLIDHEYPHLLHMWKACHLLPNLSLQVLQSRCLVKIVRGSIWMHDQLRDLGRDIVKKNSKGDITQQSRLWEVKDIQDVLKYKEKKKNTEAIELYHNDMSLMDCEFLGFDSLKFLSLGYSNPRPRISGNLPQLRWLSSKTAFVVGDLVLPNLQILDFSFSDVDENWNGWNKIQELELKSIKRLDMSHCDQLGTPVFTQNMAALERLEMKFCDRLVYVNPSIHELQNLTYLNLSDCKALSELPKELGRLGNLTELQLFGCSCLSKLPESLGNLHSLRELNLCFSGITSLPDSIGGLEKLECLNMGGCQSLISLPDSLGNLRSLIWLNIGCTKITELSSSIGRLQKLECLDMGGCESLVSLPDSLGNLRSLISLDICRTKITKLPSSIGRLQKLERLDVEGCESLVSLPDWLGDLQSLISLYIGRTKIMELPSSIGRLQKLERLDVEGCESLVSLPDWLGNLQSLIWLIIRRTKITELPSSIGRLEKLERLNMEGCESLVSLPDSLGNLRSLIRLDISHTNITELPSSIGRLQKLDDLNMKWCASLVSLPDSLGNLQSLITLDISRTKITELPSSIGRLEKLERLNMEGCKSLVCLPDWLGNLRSLIWLVIRRTRITKLPSSIGRLEKLERLNMEGCESLVSLPDSLGNLRSLIRLDISHTNITELPSSIGRLHKLEHLNMKWCASLVSLPDWLGNLRSRNYLLLPDSDDELDC